MADSTHYSRRSFLKGIGIAGAVAVFGPALAACMPAPVPGGATAGAPAAEAGGPVKLELWTFVNTHARWFESMAEDYKANVNPDFDLTVTEIEYSAMHDKLQIALQSGGVGAPDLADIEQGRFGGFLRGEDPGLIDLADRLKEGGYLDQLVAAREALYTFKGKVYGIEHALCPVVLYYRGDVYEGAGLDLTTVATWDDFIAAAKQVVSDDVKALPMMDHDVILRQRGFDYFDADGNVTLDTPESIETMEWILGTRDEHGIADLGPDGNALYGESWFAALRDGKFLSHVSADWYAGFFKDNVPDLEGKMKAVAVPAWEAGGVRTSCAGGTGNCIVKTSPNVEEAWKFQQHSMLSVEGNVRRYEMTNLWPPYIPAMDNERLHKPDTYFSGQDLGALFAELAPSVPSQYQSPYRSELNTQIGALWQDIYDLKITPADAFAQVSEAIRTTMAEEQGG